MAGLINSPAGDDFELGADINVTPLIDVMLVLLLVFMIAAPISTSSVTVDLPSISAKSPPPPDQPASVTIRDNLTTLVNDREISAGGVAAALKRAGATSATTIFLRVDKRVRYGESLVVLDALRNAGFVKVALVGLGGA